MEKLRTIQMVMKKEMPVAALAIAGAICSACLADETPAEMPPEPEPIVDTIALKPGEKHVFVWRENVTTGFSWHTVTNSATISVSIEHKGPPKTKVPSCGAPGSARVTIAALDGFKGQAEATLKNMRPWDGDTMEKRVVKVELRP